MIHAIDIGILATMWLCAFVLFEVHFVGQHPQGSIQNTTDEKNHTNHNIHLDHQRNKCGYVNQIGQHLRCIIHHGERTLFGFVHCPDIVVVELGVIIAGKVHL